MNPDDYRSIEAYVADNREMIVRVYRHSSSRWARARAWALLDAGLDPAELEQLRDELDQIQRQ